jgi:hypothetical protein
MIISEGSDKEITWEINEANPLNYSLYHNDALYHYGMLSSLSYSLSLASFSIGTHSFTLLVFDKFEFSHSCTSTVTIVDITHPKCPHLVDCEFIAGDVYAQLIWKASDLHPASYIISVNGIDNPIQAWDGSDIILQLLGWGNGNYTVKVNVLDTSSNIVYDEVTVTLLSEPWIWFSVFTSFSSVSSSIQKIKKEIRIIVPYFTPIFFLYNFYGIRNFIVSNFNHLSQL